MTVSAASLFATLPDAGATAFVPAVSTAGSDPAFDALVTAFFEAAEPVAAGTTAKTATPQLQPESSQPDLPVEQPPIASGAQTTQAPTVPSGNSGKTESSSLPSSFFSAPQTSFIGEAQTAPATTMLPLVTGAKEDALSGNEQQPISSVTAAPAPGATVPAQTTQILNTKPQQPQTVSAEAHALTDTLDVTAAVAPAMPNHPAADDITSLVTTGFDPLTQTASRPLPAPQPVASAKETASPAKAENAEASPQETHALPAVQGPRVASKQEKTESTNDEPDFGVDLLSLSDMTSRVIAQLLAALPMPEQQPRPIDVLSQATQPQMEAPSEASPAIPANAPAVAPQTNMQSGAEEPSAPATPAAAKPNAATPMPAGTSPGFAEVPTGAASAASPNTSPVTAGANPEPAANNLPANSSLPSQTELSAQGAAPGEPQRPASPQVPNGSTERPATIVNPTPTTAAQGTAQNAEGRTQTHPVPAGATAGQNPATQIDADGNAFVAQRDVPLPHRAAAQSQHISTSSDDTGNVVAPAPRNANLIQLNVAAPKPQAASASAVSANTVSQTDQNTPASTNGTPVNNAGANAQPETTEATPPASPNPAPANSTRVAEDKSSFDAQTDGRASNAPGEPKDSGAHPDAGASHAAEAAPRPAIRPAANAAPAPAAAQSAPTGETDQPAPALATSVPNPQNDAVDATSTNAGSRPATVAALQTTDAPVNLSEPVLRETSAKPTPAPRPARTPLRTSSNKSADDADASSQPVTVDRQDVNAGRIAPVLPAEHAHDQTKPAMKPAVIHIADAAPVADAPKAHDAADTGGAADLAAPQTVRSEPAPAPSAPPIHPGSNEPMLPSPATMPQGMEMAAPTGVTRGPEQDVPVKLAFTAPNVPGHAAFDEMALKIAAHSSNGESNFSIRLDPVELGKIEINLSVDAHGHAQAELSADKPQTLELLQKDASALERALKDAGLNMSGGLSFSLKGDGRSQTWRDPQGGRSRGLQIGAADAASANASITARAALAAQAYGLPTTQLDIRV